MTLQYIQTGGFYMKIVIADPLGIPTDEFRQKLSNSAPGCEITCFEKRTEDVSTLIDRCCDADILVISNIKFREDVLKECKNLKYICVAFTGYDHLDVDYCKNNDIIVSNCAGYSTSAVADLVFGMIISLYRDIIGNNAAARNGSGKTCVGPELEGKTFGVVGLGTIGTRVASIARAFGCNVIATSRTHKDIEGVKFTDLKTVMEESDIVSIHVPHTPETTKLINRDMIALMKQDAILVNTARGPIVDSNALAEALNENKIAGACIDVLEKEPPFDKCHPLLNAKNCIVTPHIAFASTQAMYKRADIVANNIAGYLRNDVPNRIC